MSQDFPKSHNFTLHNILFHRYQFKIKLSPSSTVEGNSRSRKFVKLRTKTYGIMEQSNSSSIAGSSQFSFAYDDSPADTVSQKKADVSKKIQTPDASNQKSCAVIRWNETVRKKAKKITDHHDGRRTQSRLSNKSCDKNILKISCQKLMLAMKKDEKTKSCSRRQSPTKSADCPTKEPSTSPKKTEENELSNTFLEVDPETENCVNDKKGREIIEIEVFMPFVDVENNRIVYPDSHKPIIKRYFVNESCPPKEKENPNKNLKSNRKTNGVLDKNIELQLKRTKERLKETLSKIASKSLLESSITNMPTNTSLENNLSQEDVRIDNDKKLQKRKSGKKLLTSIPQTDNKRSSENKTYGGSEVNCTTFGNDLEWKNQSRKSKKASNFQCQKASQDANEMSSSVWRDQNSRNIKQIAQVANNNFSFSRNPQQLTQCETKSLSIPELNDTLKELLICERSRREKFDLAKKSASFLAGITSARKRRGEGGLRTSTSEGRESPCKWLRQLGKNDGLSVESWVERCKFLRSRDGYSETRRPSQWPQ